MPQYSKILHKRSLTPGVIPSAIQLSGGELGVNMADGILFTKSANNGIFSFSNDQRSAFVLNTSLSGAVPQYGHNSIQQVLANVLGGLNNYVSGAGSTIVTGEANKIEGDFGLIGSGVNNTILPAGDYSAIIGGQNNLISHANCFVLGSSLSSHSANFTYVNNISGTFWGQGINLYGSTITLGTSSFQFATTAFVQEALASGTATAGVLVAQVANADTVTLTRGMVVYAFGAQGDKVSVKRASSVGDPTSSKTLGLVNDTIVVGGTGYVTLNGTMNKLSLGSPYVEGDTLWLGTDPGTFTRVKPVAPLHSVYIGVVERANAGNGTAYIKIQNGYELNEIHDVLIVDPQASQILQRNPENTLWINANPYLGTDLKALTATYVTLAGTQTLTNKTIVDWMTLVRGYKTTPTLNATIATGEVWNYVYTSSPSDKTYYRFIATDGSEDAFYASFNGTTVSNLIARKGITL